MRFFLVILLMVLYSSLTYADKFSTSEGTFITPDKDQVKIAYELFLPEKKRNSVVILLHMLGQNRNDWKKFAEKLASDGYTALAFDFRGHGESIMKLSEEPLFYRDFTSQDFSLLTEDLHGAVQEMVRQGYDSFVVIGASLGANVAVKYTVKGPGIKALVLLSPGIDYRGIRIDDLAYEIKVPILIVASNKDIYSLKSSELFLKKLNPERSNSKLSLIDGSKHGTKLLTDKKVVNNVEEFLKEMLN